MATAAEMASVNISTAVIVRQSAVAEYVYIVKKWADNLREKWTCWLQSMAVFKIHITATIVN